MPTPQDTTKEGAAKIAALSLLNRGLITKSEAARLVGVSKQLMQHWAQDIPIEKNRNAVLSKLWRQAMKKKR